MKKLLILYFGLILLALSISTSYAQNDVDAKGIYLYKNGTQDTTAIKNKRASLQSAYGNTGGLFFNKTSNKLRVWDGSAWVNFGAGGGGGGISGLTPNRLTFATSATTIGSTSATFTAGNNRITFTPDATNSGINVGSLAGNPSSLSNGDLWYNSTSSRFNMRSNTNSFSIVGTGAGLSANRISISNGAFDIIDDADLTYNFANNAISVPRILLSPTATLSGLNVGTLAGNPSSLSDGDIWVNSTTAQLNVRASALSFAVMYNSGLAASRIPYGISSLATTSEAGFEYNSTTNTMSVENIAATGRGTFTATTTLPGLNIGSFTADPSSLTNFDVWGNSTTNLIKARVNGATQNFILGSSGSTDRGIVTASGTAGGLVQGNSVTISASGRIQNLNGLDLTNGATIRGTTGASDGYALQYYDTDAAANRTAINMINGTIPFVVIGQDSDDGRIITHDNIAYKINNITGATTLSYQHSTVTCDATAGVFTVTLPACNATNAGMQYTVKKIDASANAVTLDGNGAETIDGAATQSLGTQWKYYTVQCNGSSAWYIVANN